MNESNRIESNRIYVQHVSELVPGGDQINSFRGTPITAQQPAARTAKNVRGAPPASGARLRYRRTLPSPRRPGDVAIMSPRRVGELVAGVGRPHSQKYRSICLGPSTAVNSWREGRHRRNGTSLGYRRTRRPPRQSCDDCCLIYLLLMEAMDARLLPHISRQYFRDRSEVLQLLEAVKPRTFGAPDNAIIFG